MFFPISDDNPSNTSPVITYSLIGLCLFVFFLQILSEMNPSIYYNFGFIPIFRDNLSANLYLLSSEK